MLSVSVKGQFSLQSSCNLSSNIVPLQVAKLCCTHYHPRKQHVTQQISVLQVLHEVELGSTFGNNYTQLATWNFVA